MEQQPAAFQAAQLCGAERKEGEGVLRAQPCGKEEEGRGGGASMAVGSTRRPAVDPGHRARAVALPHEQGRERVRATRCGRLTHGPERDGGPNVRGGMRDRMGERGQAMTGRRQAGPGNTVPRRRLKLFFEPIQNI
jgi:hypothetical protein